jgi:hypothetical protein
MRTASAFFGFQAAHSTLFARPVEQLGRGKSTHSLEIMHSDDVRR